MQAPSPHLCVLIPPWHPAPHPARAPPPPQVLGNAKGVVAVIVSVLYFRNPVNVYSVFGYFITVCGVVLYSQVRRQGGAGR